MNEPTRATPTQEAKKAPLPTQRCVCCGAKITLDQVEKKLKMDSWHVAYGGIICRSRGNFGSTIFDPMTSDEFLEFYLCDKCVKRKARQITRVVTGWKQEGMDEYLVRCKKLGKKYKKFGKFIKSLYKGQMSRHELSILWALQGLKDGIAIKYKHLHGDVLFEFAMPELRIAIKIVDKYWDFIGDKPDDSDEQIRRLQDAVSKDSRFVLWKVIPVRMRDMYDKLRKKTGAPITRFNSTKIRDKVVEGVGFENYSNLPEPEPAREGDE